MELALRFRATCLYFDARVADDTLKKVVWHSDATALASIVLPVPGGPNISMPCAGELPDFQIYTVHGPPKSLTSNSRIAFQRGTSNDRLAHAFSVWHKSIYVTFASMMMVVVVCKASQAAYLASLIVIAVTARDATSVTSPAGISTALHRLVLRAPAFHTAEAAP